MVRNPAAHGRPQAAEAEQPASAEDPHANPVERYRSGTISLLAGSGGAIAASQGALVAVLGNGTAQAGVTLGVHLRGVFSGGVTLGGRLGMLYPSSDGVAIDAGVGGGYAIVLGAQVALTPFVEFGVGVTTGPANTPLIITSRGGVALQIFLGDHGFIEPFVGGGAIINTSRDGRAAGVINAGYRLGVVF